MFLRRSAVLAAVILLSACKIAIDVPTSGAVGTLSGAIDCAAGQSCSVDVTDIYFDETFVGEPAPGFVFNGWKRTSRGLCGGSPEPCHLETSGFEGNDALMAFLEDPTEVFYLRPTFRSTGFNSLFIGHSFFRPFAEGMPDHAARVGIPNHEQTVIFAGGGNGAPEALWHNPARRAAIQAELDECDIELFVMTYHPDYPGIRGYRLWIDYALAQNAATRIAIALPWLTYPEQYDTATYEALWQGARTTTFHDGIDYLRSRYPDTEIFAIPYGQAAIELRKLLDAGELPDVDVMTSKTGDAIYRDALGHADTILVDLGRLVWLNAIYDVDLATYDYDPGYSTDLKAIAQSIMDGHEPEYDAPYR